MDQHIMSGDSWLQSGEVARKYMSQLYMMQMLLEQVNLSGEELFEGPTIRVKYLDMPCVCLRPPQAPYNTANLPSAELMGEGEEGEGLEGEETEEEEDEEEEFLGEVSSPLSGSDLDNALIDVTPFADIVQQYCPSLQYGRPQYNAPSVFYFVKKPLELIHLMQRLPVLVEVCDEEGASRGVGRFSLGPIFWEAVAVGYRSSSLVMPTTAASSESVSVQSPTGHSLGSVNLTLRFTCFGDTQYVELDRVEDEGDDTERTQVVSAKEGRSRANYRRVQLSETEYRKALCARDANRRHALTSANENITRTYTPSYPETAFKPDAERLLTGT